ncbi:MAG TPA: winged helix-turn-helix domain-containing protein [Thermoanaerobaculia bacterium]|nr:winged helix-turn-helix domain-containing protein [Thermoanaerobaculia bacterium]
MQRERFRIADLTVDVEAASVTRLGLGANALMSAAQAGDGQPVQLPRLSFDLLVTLARRAPAVVGADELIATVWAGIAVSDETLTQRVALLRRALGDEAKNPRYLRVVRGRGYQLVPEVVALPEPERQLPAGEQQPPEQEGRAPDRERQPAAWQRHRRTAAAAAALAALALLLAAAVFALVAFLGRGRTQPRATAAPAIATRSPSVPELLQRAGVYLGQHQAANNELAVELYQRALRLEPRNPQALAGLSLALGLRATKFNQHGGASDQALELAQQAVALDPRLGRAHHALGLALDSLGRVSPALAAYLRAARLEPQPAAALASAAHLLQVQGHLAEALETDLRAARAGGDTPIYLEVQVGATLALLGFDAAATVWFERAQELRPDNVFAAVGFARARLSESRLREADEIAAQAVRRGIRRPELADVRGLVALLGGDRPRAGAFFREALAIEPGDVHAQSRLLLLGARPDGLGSAGGPDRAGGARGYGRSDGAGAADLERRRRELIGDLRRGRATGDEWPDFALDEALLETAGGHGEAAIQALDVAIGLGFRDREWLLLDSMLARLRGDPRFVRRIERIRLLVDAERQRVVGAGWLPPGFLDGSAARR